LNNPGEREVRQCQAAQPFKNRLHHLFIRLLYRSQGPRRKRLFLHLLHRRASRLRLLRTSQIRTFRVRRRHPSPQIMAGTRTVIIIIVAIHGVGNEKKL
jgi:hypothetical protein